ncbi:hypothetical protein Tco_0728461 [Tanacetum coccineum]|uniref:Uncharacterized protein n=1 Tax=Tanacetum coccineum TaxID=301880 RepID=A0ABQ4YNM1_9ASTR
MMSGFVSVRYWLDKLAAHSKTTVNAARPKVNIVKDKNVNTVRPKAVVNAARPKAVVNAVQGNNINVVKASACWGNTQMDLQDKGVIDSGCSRHMTGNMSYLTDYEEIGILVRGLPSKLLKMIKPVCLVKGKAATEASRESMHFRLGFAWIDVLEDAAEY